MQTKFKCNLLTEAVVSAIRFSQRTVIQPGLDQEGRKNVNGLELPSKPEVIYVENCLPTVEGFKSVGYRKVKEVAYPFISSLTLQTLDANITVGANSCSNTAGSGSVFEQAYSSEILTSDVTFEFKLTDPTKGYRIAILDSSLAENTDIFAPAVAYLRAVTTTSATFATPGVGTILTINSITSADVFKFTYSGTLVTFYRNGVVVATRTVTAGTPVRAYCSLIPGSGVNSMLFGTTAAAGITLKSVTPIWTAGTNVTITGTSVVTKNIATVGYDAGAYIDLLVTDSFAVSCIAKDNIFDVVGSAFGLSLAKTLVYTVAALDYCVEFKAGDTFEVFKLGVTTGITGTLTRDGASNLSDVFEIRYSNGYILIYKNTSLIYSELVAFGLSFYPTFIAAEDGAGASYITYGYYSAAVEFAQIVELRDDLGNVGYLAITEDSKAYIATNTTPAWTVVAGTNWSAGNITIAHVSGKTYVCKPGIGIYYFNLTTSALVTPSFLGITPSAIAGICASYNYLIAHDTKKIYWSSALSPLDFVPSIATGAGSGIPTSLEAAIVVMRPLNNGFAVYSKANVVVVTYSNNTQYPWIFKPAYNSSGVDLVEDVSSVGEDGSNYAWTNAGILEINALGAKLSYVEISDYLNARIYELYDSTTKLVDLSRLLTTFRVRITFVSSRYVAISYGPQGSSFSHAFIYDTILKRWGKLKVEHKAILNFRLGVDSANTSDPQYGTVIPDNKVIYVLKDDGILYAVMQDYADDIGEGVLILGHYQIARTHMTNIEELELDNVEEASTNFTLSISSSLTGKTSDTVVTSPTLLTTTGTSRRYGSSVSGLAHDIVIEGAFDMANVLLTVTGGGRI